MRFFFALFIISTGTLFSYPFISIPGEPLDNNESIVEIAHKFVEFPNGAETYFTYEYFLFDFLSTGLSYTPNLEGLNFKIKIFKAFSFIPGYFQTGIDSQYLTYWLQLVNKNIGVSFIKDIKRGPTISCLSIKFVSSLSIGVSWEFYYIFGNSFENSIVKGGFIFQTYGHEFLLTISNTAKSSITHIPQKPNYEYLYFGFSIRRKF